MATRVAKGRSTTTPRSGPPGARSRRTWLIAGIAAVVVIVVVAVVLAVSLSGTSTKAAPTKAQVRAATQANLEGATSALAAYAKARTTCKDVACVNAAATRLDATLTSSFNRFNAAAEGYKPLASSLATYATEYAKLLGAVNNLTMATTLDQVSVIESDQFDGAQGTWIGEASALYGELGGSVKGGPTSTTAPAG
jgi:cytochrome c556